MHTIKLALFILLSALPYSAFETTVETVDHLLALPQSRLPLAATFLFALAVALFVFAQHGEEAAMQAKT
jgi:hypothetical protein